MIVMMVGAESLALTSIVNLELAYPPTWSGFDWLVHRLCSVFQKEMAVRL